MNFRTITDNEVKALAPHTFKYSVAILIYKDNEDSSVGSGTLVKIGPKYFIATAAHNLSGIADDNLYIVFKKDITYEAVPFVKRNPSSREAESAFDIGYIEISPDIAKLINEKEFLPLERITPFINFWPTRVFLTGFPAQMVSLESARKNKFTLDAIGYLTETKIINELKCDYDESTDIFVDYELNSIFVEKQIDKKMPEPYGLSGGGLWALPITQEGALWTPDNTMLIGIEKSWISSLQMVRCTQMQHWLRFVAEDYPDLRNIIEKYLILKETKLLGLPLIVNK
jgi:hypothetical protein